MDNLINEIVLGFSLEKDTVSDSLKSRAEILANYLRTIDLAIVKLRELATIYRDEIQPLIAEKESHQKILTDAKNEHVFLQEKHAKFLQEKDLDILIREKKIADSTEKQKTVDNVVEGLMVEYRNVEKQLTALRGQVSTVERQVKEHIDEDRRLTTSIELKKVQNTELDNEIERKRKEFSHLSTDNAILQNQIKK